MAVTLPAPASSPFLDAETIADLLSCARAGDQADFLAILASVRAAAHSATGVTLPEATIVSQLVDPRSGNSVLHYVAANGHLDMLNRILRALHPATSPHGTPPRADVPPPPPAAANGSRSAAPAHVLINALNAAGSAPLHWAAVNGHADVVRALLAAGADPRCRDAAGKDPAGLAEAAGHYEIAELLRAECGDYDEADSDDGKHSAGGVRMVTEEVPVAPAPSRRRKERSPAVDRMDEGI